MKNPRLLVTGINGQVGSIVRPALEEDYEVHGLDAKGPFNDRVSHVDITDLPSLSAALADIRPLPLLLHLAAQSNASASWEQVLQPNIIGTHNVFEAARQAGVTRIVYASSNHVTGAYEGFEPHLHLHLQSEPEKITTSHPIRPDGDYGVSKAFGEALARYYAARWGIHAICLRIGSVLPDDNPTTNPRFAKTWLSHRDLVHLITRALRAPVSFGIYYGVSNNTGRFWDISNAAEELSYQPQDDAAAHLRNSASA